MRVTLTRKGKEHGLTGTKREVTTKVYKNIIFVNLLVTFILVGCGSNQMRGGGKSPSFIEGLAAIERKDFSIASYHFSGLAKEGNPGAMNNLGVSLLMVDREGEALYWFKKASRYGNQDARSTLMAMGESVPPSDLAGKHPTQLRREATEKFIVTTLLGVAIGVTAYYASKGSTAHYQHSNPGKIPSTSTYSDSLGVAISAKSVCNCKGYAGPGGPCYSGPGGSAYNGPGGPAYEGPGGACYAGPGGPAYDDPGGPAYDGPGGPRYAGPGGPAYNGPGGPAYDGPGGACYSGPSGPCYSGPGGTGMDCPSICW